MFSTGHMARARAVLGRIVEVQTKHQIRKQRWSYSLLKYRSMNVNTLTLVSNKAGITHVEKYIKKKVQTLIIFNSNFKKIWIHTSKGSASLAGIAVTKGKMSWDESLLSINFTHLWKKMINERYLIRGRMLQKLFIFNQKTFLYFTIFSKNCL